MLEDTNSLDGAHMKVVYMFQGGFKNGRLMERPLVDKTGCFVSGPNLIKRVMLEYIFKKESLEGPGRKSGSFGTALAEKKGYFGAAQAENFGLYRGTYL